MPSPTPLPGVLAAAASASAAWNWVYWSRLPAIPILARVSMASSTSGGSEMFSMMNVGTAIPTGFSSWVSTPASLVPMDSCWVARSSIGTPEVASALPSLPTISWRR